MAWVRWPQGREERRMSPRLCPWDVRCSDPSSQRSSPALCSRKTPRKPWGRLRPRCRRQEVRGPLALRRTGFAQRRRRLCQPPRGRFPPSRGACVRLFPEERPYFQQRVLGSWGSAGGLPLALDLLWQNEAPRFPSRGSLAGAGRGVLCCPGGPAGPGLGRRPLAKTLTFFHLKPSTFRSGWPICPWPWFGLSRERSNWA